MKTALRENLKRRKAQARGRENARPADEQAAVRDPSEKQKPSTASAA